MNRDTLIRKLEADIGRSAVVTIAGSGVSVAACRNQKIEDFEVATWTGLLRHGVQHCKNVGLADDEDAGVLTSQINSRKTDFLISAAETITQRLRSRGPGVFRGWLKDTVGALTIQDRAILDALAAIPGVLATLNYDNLIEDATHRRAITWLKADDVQDVLTGSVTDAVLHLHGWFKEPESVVLGLGSYLTVKEHPHAAAVLNLFSMDRTLLFVGCGDTIVDPNFTRLIEWGQSALQDVTPRHYVLCRTSEIGAFQTRLAAAPWLQPLDYGAEYGDLVPFLESLAPKKGVAVSATTGVSIGSGLDLHGYQLAMRKRYGRLKLEDLDPTTHDVRPMLLTGMYVSQNAREFAEFVPRLFELPKDVQRRLREAGEFEDAGLDPETLETVARAYLDQSPRPILEVIGDPAFSRLVVLGDPGSGKSILLQYLLLMWADGAAPGLMGEPLPLLIELREYARLRHEGRVDSFLGYLHEGASVRWHLNQAQLDAWLQANPSVVLFDGLDEIFDPTLRREIATAIHRFADHYARARIVVTSRVVGYQHQAWRDEGFRQVVLQELDEPQIADFVARWHRGAYQDPAKGEAKRALLARAIEDSAAIRQLAANPLLLTMMAILNRTQDLPRDRAELYEQCTRLLLHQWKVDVAFAADALLHKAALDFKDKRGLLLRVAHAMQASSGGLAGNLIDESTLETTLAEGLQGVPDMRAGRAARALIDQLRGQNFMLCSLGGRNYGFVHRTFLEYFCAVEIRERFQTEQTLSIEELKTEAFGHWPDETWHEVLCLLGGMLAPRFVATILEWLLDQPDSPETYRHVFLAARCLGEVRKRGELADVERRILERLKAGTRFDPRRMPKSSDHEGAEIVAGVRSRAVALVATIWPGARDTFIWLKARAASDEHWAVRESAVQALARDWKGEPEALSTVKALVQFEEHFGVRRTAVQALAHGWKDDPETLPMLKAVAESEEDPACESALQELARGWKDDPETLPWLRVHAQSGEPRVVRPSAVQELARGWKDDPETLPVLKALAQFDEDWAVRQHAVEELARGWRGNPETLPVLKASAQTDQDWTVRLIAVRELARSWKGDPETLPLLKARAQADEDWNVRQTAVQELARGWKDDPGTLPILKARAQSDKDASVRSSAVQELARGWRGDPQTLPWLKSRAQSDEHFAVRRIAVQELARGWKDDPETLPILKARAQSDEHHDVRRNAMEALVRGWRDDPETSTILKARAESDEDESVHQSALLELAGGWRDDPGTLPMLKERAQFDEDFTVRGGAMQALARGWRDDPETVPILRTRAESDEHHPVRVAAVEELARGWKDDPQTLPWLKARAQSTDYWPVRQTAVRELVHGWKDEPETLPWLMACAQSDAHEAVRLTAAQEVARAWKNDPAILSWLKARAEADKEWAVRRLAVRELARCWKDDPEVLPILKARAQSDERWEVRRSAVQELARGWKDDPETRPILNARAQSDEQWEVRLSAVQELARGWSDDPEIAQFLKTCAQSDERREVCERAVQELVSGWKHDSETLPWLKARVRSNERFTVRQIAVRELARGWKDDPEVLPILKARAKSDEDGLVRGIAVLELARGWKDDPETLPLLKACAESHKEALVREAAVQQLALGWRDDPDVRSYLANLSAT